MKLPRVFVFTAFFLSFIPALVFAGSLGSWKQLPPAPTMRTEVAVALLAGKIYLIGGFTPKGITDKVVAFDLATGTWQAQSPLPRPLHHTTASVVNNKLYVIGGFGSATWTPTNVNYMYDPETHHWTVKTPMPTERGALSAAVIDDKIYAVGGALRKFFRLVNTGANEVYDPDTDQWQKLAPVPTPRDHLAVSSWQGKLYVIGGRVNVNYRNNLDANEVYDSKAKTWTKLKPLPTARSGITSQVLNGKIHVLGGESGDGTFKENEAYDPSKDEWVSLSPMPEGRHGLGSAVADGKLHILTGGPKPGGGGSDTHWVYSPK
jgi:N-acetylneuraminic acid mutarotase